MKTPDTIAGRSKSRCTMEPTITSASTAKYHSTKISGDGDGSNANTTYESRPQERGAYVARGAAHAADDRHCGEHQRRHDIAPVERKLEGHTVERELPDDVEDVLNDEHAQQRSFCRVEGNLSHSHEIGPQPEYEKGRVQPQSITQPIGAIDVLHGLERSIRPQEIQRRFVHIVDSVRASERGRGPSARRREIPRRRVRESRCACAMSCVAAASQRAAQMRSSSR